MEKKNIFAKIKIKKIKKIKSNKTRQNFRKIKFSKNEIFVDKNVLNV